MYGGRKLGSEGWGFESLRARPTASPPSGPDGSGTSPVSNHTSGTPVRIAQARSVTRMGFRVPVSALLTEVRLIPSSAANAA